MKRRISQSIKNILYKHLEAMNHLIITDENKFSNCISSNSANLLLSQHKI